MLVLQVFLVYFLVGIALAAGISTYNKIEAGATYWAEKGKIAYSQKVAPKIAGIRSSVAGRFRKGAVTAA